LYARALGETKAADEKKNSEFCGAACQLSIDFGIKLEACCGKFCVYERSAGAHRVWENRASARTPALTFFEP